ncbi:galactoside 2-alpha-L-fucosyltransferase-like [Rutidosis leptorrhynchoides]|uniref:galactoside 2-alpha-L-fucosyltransferase-like n=1 Tax=Rutidosis leptorrhynchoides TaxID=125765 RepID=UPI003A98F963
MRRLHKNSSDLSNVSDENQSVSRDQHTKFELNQSTLTGIIIVSFMGFFAWFFVSVIFRNFAVNLSLWSGAHAKVLDIAPPPTELGHEEDSMASVMEKLQSSLMEHGQKVHSSVIEHEHKPYYSVVEHEQKPRSSSVVEHEQKPRSSDIMHEQKPHSFVVEHKQKPRSLVMEHEQNPHSSFIEHEQKPRSFVVEHEQKPRSFVMEHEQKPHSFVMEHEQNQHSSVMEHEQNPHYSSVTKHEQNPHSSSVTEHKYNQHPSVIEHEHYSHSSVTEHEHNLHFSSIEHDEKLLNDGLFSSQFDKHSCLSRYQVSSYRKQSPYKPSSYLISKLRRYEALHKSCGLYTKSYNTTVSKLWFGSSTKETSDCKYLIWVPFSGLGNRLLSLVSTFLYALLSDRVLLVDRGDNLDDLFCEPFPESSWLLPPDFPLIGRLQTYDQNSPECFGNMLKMKKTSTSSPFLYLHQIHDYDNHDKLFFCDQEHNFIQKFSWVILKSNFYSAPSFFLMDTYKQELHSLFPEKDTVFHFLGRYILLPTNPVWGLVTRYYNSYLAQADERIGIQVRVFDPWVGHFKYVLDLVLTCSLNNNLIPKINTNVSFNTSPRNQKSKAVMITSLSSGYSDKIRDMYWEHATLTGEIIQVFQPSHEEVQQTENKLHERKALAEMYLLSLSDKLITSSFSTFGYVAQGLGGLNPWILYHPKNGTTQNPACTHAMSSEPCFHFPMDLDCKTRSWADTGAVVPHVRRCEDVGWGLKLVNPTVK